MAIERKKLTAGEWAVIVGAVVTAIAVTRLLGLRQKWRDPIAFSASLFSCVAIVLRPFWRRKGFWPNLIAIFLFHCAILAAIVKNLPSASLGPHGLPMIAASMAEGALIVIAMAKKLAGDRFE